MSRKLFAEFLGTLFLLATVVGSGIMAVNLSGPNVGLELLCNMVATGAILVVLILIFGPISGAHFNPAVTLVFLLRKELSAHDAAGYMVVQVLGGIAGVILAHVMFNEPLIFASTTIRTGLSQWVAEFVATFGLIATILGCLKFCAEMIPFAVGLFISAAYWFTSSTSFANPAVTIARALTDTFAGILPSDVPAFILAQLVGAVCASMVFGWLLSEEQDTEQDSVPDRIHVVDEDIAA